MEFKKYMIISKQGKVTLFETDSEKELIEEVGRLKRTKTLDNQKVDFKVYDVDDLLFEF